ncbi:MAG TPA: isoprenylcysteine carboxylmethyltransferase family protein [Sphingomicrobium sp.]|nr:isoprenylcysteine carboxylmethyltransferase family protein [Sphingomicrobium sp.]
MTWTAFWIGIAILGFVTLQRLIELRLAERNSKRLLAEGAKEHAAGHYPFLVAIHMAWLAALWWWAPGRPVDVPLLLLFAALQVGRIWVIATLGRRWTTRIIVLPGAPLVRSGPYRYLSHPNYVIVTAEIAVLPLVFGLVEIAVAFSILNLAVLAVRIPQENKALDRLRR